MANGGDVVFHFKGDTKALESSIASIDSISTKSASAIGKAFTNVSKVIAGAVGGMAVGLGSAIKRFDTLKNYPKVLSNLGLSAEDAERSIKALSDGIDGLPTALDDAASGVQRLVAKNGDIDKSTKYFLALNDAIVAGNAPAEMQKSAIEQLTQAYSKGKPDMMEWRTLMMAMPGQLKQVAQAMGMVNTDDLYEALKKGKISMDDFMDTLVYMDQNGSEEFMSFQEQAKNSCDSIGTAVTNLSNRVKKGFATILSSLDSVANNTTFGSIAGMINNLSTTIKTFLDKIGDAVKNNEAVGGLMNTIAGALTKVSGAVNGLNGDQMNTLVTAFVGLMKVAPVLGIVGNALPKVSSGFSSLGTSAQSAMQTMGSGLAKIGGAGSTLEAVGSKLGYVGIAINGLTKAINISAIIGTLIAGIGAIDTATGGALDKFVQDICDKIPGWIEQIIGIITNKLPAILQAGVKIIKNILTTINQNLPRIIEAVNMVLNELIHAVAEIAPSLTETIVGLIVGFVNILISNLPYILEVLIGVIVGLVNAIATQLPTILPTIVDAIITIIPLLINALISAIPTLLQACIQLLMALVQAIPKVIVELVKALPTIITSIVTTLFEHYPEIMEAGFQLLLGLVTAIPKMTIELWKALPEIWEAIKQYFTECLPKMWDSAKEMFGRFADGIKASVGKVREKVSEIIDNIRNFFAELPSKAWQWASDFISGFANGIMNFANRIVDKVRNIAQNIRNLLHFSKPDEGPLRDYEKWMPDFIMGLTKTLHKATPMLVDEVQSLSDKMQIGLEAGDYESIFDMSPSLYNSNTQSNSVNIVINNNMETDMLGNLVNNIKTYTNGSKQDFSYGIGG